MKTPSNIWLIHQGSKWKKITKSNYCRTWVLQFTSPEIYNFSELLEQPLLKTLENSKFKWVYELLTIFNQGDIATFNSVIDDASNRDVILFLF